LRFTILEARSARRQHAPHSARIDLDGTGSDQLKSTFTLCLKCHDRTRFASSKQNQGLVVATPPSRQLGEQRVFRPAANLATPISPPRAMTFDSAVYTRWPVASPLKPREVCFRSLRSARGHWCAYRARWRGCRTATRTGAGLHEGSTSTNPRVTRDKRNKRTPCQEERNQVNAAAAAQRVRRTKRHCRKPRRLPPRWPRPM
jgi:hypothetical protein